MMMNSLLNPRAAARIKAAFDTYELVAKTVQARRRAAKAKPKAAQRGAMLYERGTGRLVPSRG
jgi:hypothetical protein